MRVTKVKKLIYLRISLEDRIYSSVTEKLQVLTGRSNASSSSCLSSSQPKRQRPLTSLLISSCLSGAERAVALIMVDVWLSVSFLIQRWPATMLQTYRASRNSSLIKQNQSERRNNHMN